ncbi:MAG TPA: GAF domain-containing protein [Actinomycetes bacterium]|nr:GAF domain-containing protein [Actinomycetes bacterium]
MTADPSPELVRLTVALGDALGVATRPTSLNTELDRAVARLRSLFAAAACSCALVRNDGGTLEFVAADGVGADSIIGVELPIGRGIAGWVAMSGQPILTTDVAEDSRFARDIAESTNYVPDTILAAPLLDEDSEVIGVIEVLDPQSRGPHSGHDLETLGIIAAQLASIIRLCEVYDALGQALVGGLATSVESDDLAAAFSELTESDPARQELIALAQSFHDLSASGPRGAALAARILSDVATFTRTGR